MNDEMNLAKLSVLLNSAVRMNTSNRGVRGAAYVNTMKMLESSLPLCRNPTSSQKSRENPTAAVGTPKAMAQEKQRFKNADRKQDENLSKSCDGKNIKTIVKKRMKWNDYLAIQVEKQRKINEELSSTLKEKSKGGESPGKSPVLVKKAVKVERNVGGMKEKINLKEFEKDLKGFKEVRVKDNFKKLDEQEGFVEENEKIEEEEEEEVEQIREENEELQDEMKDEQSEADKRIQEIIQRYEKTIGKIKVENKPSTPSILSVKISKASEKRSKSAYSNYSTDSQKVAIDKLKALEEEEKRIQQQKEEILRILDSRSQKRDASRPMTVSSLYSMKSERKKPDFPVLEKSPMPVLPTVKLERPKTRQSTKVSKRSDVSNEVKELLSNLFD